VKSPGRALRGPVIGLLVRFFGRLRFPYLVAVTATLFVVDLFVPDVIPLADELLLGLVTAILASFKKPRALPDADAHDTAR
jgi:hypothetical protein